MAPILKGQGDTYSLPVTSAIAEADVAKFAVVSSGNAVVASTAGTQAIGVILAPTLSATDPVLLQLNGIVEVQAGGTIAIGDQVTTNNAGRAIVAATGNRILGRALSTGANNGRVTILLNTIAGSVV
jgi:hypothetical protein